MVAENLKVALSESNYNDGGINLSKLKYITEMLAELRKLAVDLDENTLNYLIEMAILEANQRLEVVGFRQDLAS